LAGCEPVAHLARGYQVSRKFVCQQKAKVSDSLRETFTRCPDDRKVLFHLPVTRDWLRQFVLAQVLIGHTSFRGVSEILDAVFDFRDLSIGTVHNIIQDAVESARRINDCQSLSAIRVGAHDEIYQGRRPVLVGADIRSTFCYLLAIEDHCDETTWAVHLLDLPDQHLHPDRTIADGGHALRAGQAAWDEIPSNADVFHAERELGRLAYYLDNRAAGCTTARQKLADRMTRLRRRGKGQSLSKKLALARQAEQKAVHLAETPRASSIIENLNSRLRNYFFLRRHIADAYLDLLRLFLNHRRFLRSGCAPRRRQEPG
jgi:hypothetical protein